MEQVILYISIALTAIISIPFYRVINGPTVFDRLLAASAIGTKTLVLVILIGYLFNRIDMFIDIALAYATLNFIGALIIAKYFGANKSD